MKKEDPKRFRTARADASIKALRTEIAKTFGLPLGSVRIDNPNGGRARSHGRVRSLRNRWDSE